MSWYNRYPWTEYIGPLIDTMLSQKMPPKSGDYQRHSMMYVKKVALDTAARDINIIFDMEQAYHYQLDGFRLHYPNDDPEMHVEIADVYTNTPITPNFTPLPTRLLSTPGNSQILKPSMWINRFFPNSALMHFKLTNHGSQADTFVYFITEGIRIPVEE